MLFHKAKMLLVLLALLMAACQPVPLATPIPTPDVWEIQYTPTLSWLGPDFRLCMQAQPHASIVVFESPASSLDPVGVDFAFRWGPPPELQGYAAVTGWDELVMIVHPSNPVENLTLSDIMNIYTGTSRTWSLFNPVNSPVSGRIRLWSYPAGNDVMDVFETLSGEPLEGDAVLHLAPDPQAMLEAVAEDPAAIGFIPGRWLNEHVRQVVVSDLNEEDLRQPILALRTAEPQGDRRAWLLCLQEQLKEE
jgi:hypothetical protein